MRITSLSALIFAVAALVVATAPSPAQAAAPTGTTAAAANGTVASAQRGKILTQTCAFCHGLENYTIPYPTRHVPLIGAQHAQYVISALHEYAEDHRDFATMKAQGASLTDQQIHDIATYIAGLGQHLPATNDNQKAPPFAASCAACHGAQGVSTNPQYPTLAGQYEDYLLLSLKEYKSGKRKNAIMNAMAGSLTLEQMKQLAHYFATQKSPLVLLPLPGPG